MLSFLALPLLLLPLTSAHVLPISRGNSSPFPPRPPSSKNAPKVLVYTYTADFHHDSIPFAIQALKDHGLDWKIDFTFSENMKDFTDDNLKNYDSLMFVSATGDALDAGGQAAFQKYIESGGNFMGVHAAAACLFNDAVYGETLGAAFDYHPSQPLDATFVKTNISHPATKNVPDGWRYTEEIYHFGMNPQDNGATIILGVDESSYKNDGVGSGYQTPAGQNPPMAWYMDPPKTSTPYLQGVSKGGRTFYTGLGHTNAVWSDNIFMDHIMNGLVWTLDGASTLAYGVGAVGNSQASPPPPATSSSTYNHGDHGAAIVSTSTASSGPVRGSATEIAQKAESTKSGAARMRQVGLAGVAGTVVVVGYVAGTVALIGAM
ncbi:hypothetical protein IAR55_003929 [Kwoniella newhampshirensis]|uniref:ThuA-like domain-containing protein n=1 Tax=Kwoniella newhampshirensis TaxID=1651941 RepID=A0AAW0YL08_9TREE